MSPHAPRERTQDQSGGTESGQDVNGAQNGVHVMHCGDMSLGDQVRALARDIEYQEQTARRESSEAVETVYRIIGRRLRAALDTNPKPAPSGAKAGSNEGEARA